MRAGALFGEIDKQKHGTGQVWRVQLRVWTQVSNSQLRACLRFRLLGWIEGGLCSCFPFLPGPRKKHSGRNAARLLAKPQYGEVVICERIAVHLELDLGCDTSEQFFTHQLCLSHTQRLKPTKKVEREPSNKLTLYPW